MKKWLIPLALSAALFSVNVNADTWYNRFRDARDIPFTQSGGGAVSTTVQAVVGSSYVAAQFGIVADGATDQSAKINAALSACAARGGGLLYLPGSSQPYMIGSSINPTEGCGIIGDGMNVPSVQQDQAGATPKTTIKALASFNGVMINFPARTFAPYTTGTVTVTNGSTTVTCSGCNWNNIPVSSGAFKVSGDSVSYIVASRTATTLTLTTAYLGSSGGGKSYTADSTTITKPAINSWYGQHFTLDGNKGAGATASGIWYDPGNAASIGIQTQDARHRWDDVAIHDVSGYGAYFGPPHRAIRLDGFRVEKAGFDGIRTEGSDYTFNNLLLGENGLCGINILGGVSVKIVGGESYSNRNNFCAFDSTYFATSIAGGGNLPTQAVSVSNFEFDRALNDGVNIGGASRGILFSGVTFGGGDGSASCGTYAAISLSSSYVGPALKINGGFAVETVTPGSPCAKYVLSFGGSAFVDINGFEAPSSFYSTAFSNNNTFARRYAPNGSSYVDANNKEFGAKEYNDAQTFDASPVLKTITGLVKGNGSSAVTAATAGTDYAPATSGSAVLKGNGAGGFSSAVSGTDYAPATSGSLVLKGNGSGGFTNVSNGQLPATATNDSASSGNLGEFVSSSVASGSAVSLTSGSAANLTSVSLTAGDWDVECTQHYVWGAATLGSYSRTSLSTTSATTDFSSDRFYSIAYYGIKVADTASWTSSHVGATRFSLASTTTVYCVADAAFSTSTLSVWGHLRARRAR